MSPHSADLFDPPPAPRHALLEGRVDLVPPKTSHHRKKIVRRGKFMSLADTEELTAARSVWFAALERFRPPAPLEGALELELSFSWPWRKSDVKVARHGFAIPYTSRPDCDNLAKTITDVMTTLTFFRDDAQVTRLIVSKFLGPRPGLTFAIRVAG